MYTGTLIDDLIAMVQRVEEHLIAECETAELERMYFAGQPELHQYDQNLLGVA